MSARSRAARWLSGPEEWNRRRLQILFGIASGVVLAVVAGIVWSVLELLGDETDASGLGRSTELSGDAPVGALGSVEDAQPGPLADGWTGTIAVPQPASVGEAQVGTGFPRSPEGALAQLIAIDRRAIESTSVVTAQDVIDVWAATGGPTAESWSGVAAVKALLESAGLPANGSSEFAVQLEPSMGLIQASDDGSATVCVDFILTVVVGEGAPDRIAAADCQHMAWTDDRWVIASGDEATPTPSLWPGTQASYDAGYQWLEVAP
ncbi:MULTISPECIES: hypothetical protein [unclassified Nocardioides]|uniref:hypothetical protein n=1 Tax=unclassified Nocardioides TaxID=2615069 RepID=UPI0006F2607A|nr:MULTISPECIES: hypothetical protein [unclassified Nocardioides]KRA39359.1 hypothetical protein ASD81_04420 [Nocardioides sp. Root614]KRA93324.1 hypothetical protein ASD84_04685 [Nocardioides sp. Root682]